MPNDLIRPDNPTGIAPVLVDAPTAAGLLSVSERTLRSAEWADLPRIKRGGRVLFAIDVLRQWAIAESRPAEKKLTE
jgi:hypothetical protein